MSAVVKFNPVIFGPLLLDLVLQLPLLLCVLADLTCFPMENVHTKFLHFSLKRWHLYINGCSHRPCDKRAEWPVATLYLWESCGLPYGTGCCYLWNPALLEELCLRNRNCMGLLNMLTACLKASVHLWLFFFQSCGIRGCAQPVGKVFLLTL